MPARPTPVRSATARAGLHLLLALAIAAAAWLRLPPATGATVWAEDADTFLAGALRHEGPLAAYAGYLHLVPRMLATAVVGTVPMEGWAFGMAAASCLVVGLIGAAVFRLTHDVVPSRVVRIALALVPALTPLAGVELLANTANLHTFLLYATPFLLVARLRTWPGALAAALFALVISLTEIQAALFLPLALVGWRERRRLPMLGALVVGLALQAGTYLTLPRDPDPDAPSSALDVGRSYLFQVLGGTVDTRLGDIGRLVVDHGFSLVVLPVTVLVLAAVVAGTIAAAGRVRILVVALTFASVLIWVAAVVLNPHWQFSISEYTPETFAVPPISRYAAASSLFLVAALVLSSGALFARRALPARVAGGLVAALLVAAVAVNFLLPWSTRSGGPVWADEVAAAVARCADDPAQTVRLGAAPTIERWYLELDCAEFSALAR